MAGCAHGAVEAREKSMPARHDVPDLREKVLRSTASCQIKKCPSYQNNLNRFAMMFRV